MDTVFTLFIAAFIVLALVNAWYELRLDVPPIPTMPAVRRAIVDLVPPGTGPIIELGAGCGGLSLRLARAFPDRPVVALEVSFFPYVGARLLQMLTMQRNLSILRQDLFSYSLAKAQTVVFYLTPRVLARLAPKLTTELPRGATVISSSFPIPGWQPERTITVTGPWTTPVYCYRKT